MSASTLIDREVPLKLEIIPALRSRTRNPSKLDNLAWRAGLCVVAYGVRLGVRSNQADTLEECLPYLPSGWKASNSPTVDRVYSIVCDEKGSPSRSPGFYLYKDTQQLARASERREIFERLESDSALYVAENSQRRIFVHAGVVGWDNRAIVIPGKSFAGKSTLVADLVRLGATYYSDEFAVLDQNGLVHPYPRPLQLREEGGTRQVKRSAEDLGGVSGKMPLPVGLVLLSRYKSEAKWRPRHLSSGQALLGLLDNTVSARRQPAAALKTLKEAVRDSFAVKGLRGDSREVVNWISAHFHPRQMFTPSGE